MSETVMYKGKLKNLNITPEEFCKQQMLNYALQGYKTYSDAINCEFYQKLYASEYRVYKIELDAKVDEYSDIFQSKQNGKDIDFLLKYYDGGCGFEEALNKAIENME